MKIVMFEPADFDLLYPLTYLRPVFDLRCGALTLREKLQEKFPDCELHLEVRDARLQVARDIYGAGAINNPERLTPDEDVLLTAAGAILTEEAAAYTGQERLALTEDGDFIWAYLEAETVGEIGAESAAELATRAASTMSGETTEDILIRNPWDLVIHNARQIEADFAAHYAVRNGADPGEGVAVWGEPESLYIAEGAEVQPCTFIDCREGPVAIEDGAVVQAHSSIHGPAFIGTDSYLCEARIREGTTVGPVCRVGGEVEESILHAYVNKYHTGFLGHAYVCEWVNLGALTANSDLKNDYSTVSIYRKGKPVDTGAMKVGAFIGDHTKTSIGTMLNTGSVVGVMCNLVGGGGVLPKDIPSFAWYLNGRIGKGLGRAYALDTARAAMERRGVELTEAMVKLVEHTHELTREARMEKVRRDRRKAFG